VPWRRVDDNAGRKVFFCMMKLKMMPVLIASLLLGAVSVSAQGLFEEKYKACMVDTACIYCGDSMAWYPENLTHWVVNKIEHSVNNSMYEIRSFDVLYEVLVDSTGRSCVVSIRSVGASYSWLLKEDIRKWLTGLAGWHPATKNGVAINSTLIIEASFRSNFFGMKLASPPTPKRKKKDK